MSSTPKNADGKKLQDQARRCPVCKSAMSVDDTRSSFCSDRCKLIDLQRWFDGDYAIPGLPATEEDENLH